MSADVIHHGHINILRIAKKFGKVYVGLLTEKAIKEYKSTPIFNYEQRKAIIKSIKYVDKIRIRGIFLIVFKITLFW